MDKKTAPKKKRERKPKAPKGTTTKTKTVVKKTSKPGQSQNINISITSNKTTAARASKPKETKPEGPSFYELLQYRNRAPIVQTVEGNKTATIDDIRKLIEASKPTQQQKDLSELTGRDTMLALAGLNLSHNYPTESDYNNIGDSISVNDFSNGNATVGTKARKNRIGNKIDYATSEFSGTSAPTFPSNQTIISDLTDDNSYIPTLQNQTIISSDSTYSTANPLSEYSNSSSSSSDLSNSSSSNSSSSINDLSNDSSNDSSTLTNSSFGSSNASFGSSSRDMYSDVDPLINRHQVADYLYNNAYQFKVDPYPLTMEQINKSKDKLRIAKPKPINESKSDEIKRYERLIEHQQQFKPPNNFTEGQINQHIKQLEKITGKRSNTPGSIASLSSGETTAPRQNINLQNPLATYTPRNNLIGKAAEDYSSNSSRSTNSSGKRKISPVEKPKQKFTPPPEPPKQAPPIPPPPKEIRFTKFGNIDKRTPAQIAQAEKNLKDIQEQKRKEAEEKKKKAEEEIKKRTPQANAANAAIARAEANDKKNKTKNPNRYIKNTNDKQIRVSENEWQRYVKANYPKVWKFDKEK